MHLKKYHWYCLYFVLFFIIAIGYFYNHSIRITDTDLWYHLNNGRYISQHHSLPQDSFFSFLKPLREQMNYSWLFRIVVFKIYSHFDYYGLILLRGILYILFISIVLYYTFFSLPKEQRNFGRVLLFTIASWILLARMETLRPHIFSYVFMILAIFLLDNLSKKTWLLPVVALLWCNIHGVSYPVLILITFAYGAEFLYQAYTTNKLGRKEKYGWLALFFSIILVIMFGTPHGIKLLAAPFTSLEYARSYVVELKSLDWQTLFSFSFIKLVPTFSALVIIVFFLTTFGVIYQIAHRKLRISHFILYIGSLILLSQCVRFRNEFTLLALPFLKQQAGFINLHTFEKKAPFLRVFACILLLAAQVQIFDRLLPTKQCYPLAKEKLPLGVVTFLKHVKGGGNILNRPNYGGYLQWKLYPQYKITMDMQIPHLFSDADYFIVKNTMRDPQVFRYFVTRYKPSFVLAELVLDEPIALKNNEEYKPVYFDDVMVLYANNKIYPDLVKKYTLVETKPFLISDLRLSDLSIEQQSKMYQELLQIQKIYNGSRLVNQTLAMIENQRGQYAQAIQHADLVIKNYPGLAKGYRLKGDALYLSGFTQRALECYKEGVSCSPEETKSEVQIKVGFCYLKMQKFQKAYNAFEKAKAIFSSEVRYQYLYGYALAANKIGKWKKAYWLLCLADLKIPNTLRKWKQKVYEEKLSIEKLIKK